jgi:hypothetical protein
MCADQVMALKRMLGASLLVTKLGSSFLRSSSSPLEVAVPMMPAIRPMVLQRARVGARPGDAQAR